jgi:hypothetical protein
MIKGYKLFHLRKNGTLGPLFINAKMVVPIGKRMRAESHPTKGFAFRPGWHAATSPIAPHLKMKKDRVWCEVQLEGIRELPRPKRQGGVWLICKYLKVVKIMNSKDVKGCL